MENGLSPGIHVRVKASEDFLVKESVDILLREWIYYLSS